MSKLKAVNISLCLFNNAIFIIRLGQILNFWNTERKINTGLAEINTRINDNKNDFIISGLRRDNGHSVDRIKSYCLDTAAVFGTCLISTAVSYFAANKTIATIANTGLTGANILFVTLMGKYFPKQSNSYEFVETTDAIAVDAKRFYYHLSSQTLLSKERKLDQLSAGVDCEVMYTCYDEDNSLNTEAHTWVNLLHHQNNESMFKVYFLYSCSSRPIYGVVDKLDCIMNTDTYRDLTIAERSTFGIRATGHNRFN